MWADWAEKFFKIFWSKVQSLKSAKSTFFLQIFAYYLFILELLLSGVYKDKSFFGLQAAGQVHCANTDDFNLNR